MTKRGLVIFVGGTGLYFGALTEGLSPIPPVPAAVRTEVRRRFEALGRDAFFAELDKLTGKEIETRLEASALQTGARAFAGVFLFTVLMITREGMETALMMGTLLFQIKAIEMILGAVAAGAKELLFITDVAGLLDADGNVVPRLHAADAKTFIENVTGGMKPKLQAALSALNSGVGAITIGEEGGTTLVAA